MIGTSGASCACKIALGTFSVTAGGCVVALLTFIGAGLGICVAAVLLDEIARSDARGPAIERRLKKLEALV